MKFNWGTGIAFVYGLFALSMVGAVFASQRYKPRLVQKNYYELDLNYQARLDKKQNTASLPTLPKVRFQAQTGMISIHFPAEMQADGSAKLYRSATVQDDFVVKMEGKNTLEIPAQNLASGRWHVELDWDANGKGYFWETTITL